MLRTSDKHSWKRRNWTWSWDRSPQNKQQRSAVAESRNFVRDAWQPRWGRSMMAPRVESWYWAAKTARVWKTEKIASHCCGWGIFPSMFFHVDVTFQISFLTCILMSFEAVASSRIFCPMLVWQMDALVQSSPSQSEMYSQGICLTHMTSCRLV